MRFVRGISGKRALRYALAPLTVALMVAGLALMMYLFQVQQNVRSPLTTDLPLATLAVVMAFTGVCLVWAPFGAAISIWLARGAQSPMRSAALTGATYSLTFLFPWIYMVIRARGKRVWRPVIWLAYIFLYVIWLWGLIASSLGGFVLSITMGGEEVTSPLSVLFGGAAALMSIAWCTTLYLLLAAALDVGRRTNAAPASGDWPIRGVYYAPFALASGSVVLLALVGIYFAHGV